MTKHSTIFIGARVSALLLLAMLLMPGSMMAQGYKYYRGFFDAGLGWVPTGAGYGSSHFSTGTLTTTHGYYVGDHTFVGIGAGISFDEEVLTLPLYLDVRYNLSFTSELTPTFELRAGPYFDLYQGERASFYGDAAAGVRWALGGRTALNLMLNLSYYQGFQILGFFYSPYTDFYLLDVPLTLGVRLGVEW
jgi:hypothetical protein